MIDDPNSVFSPAYENRLVFYTSAGESLDLRNHYAGGALILTLPGPSMADPAALDAIRESGVPTMGVNNSWAVYRPDLWVCIDAASSFLADGWRDPRILKLTTTGNRMTRLREKRDDGTFRTLGITPGRSPNTLFFKAALGFNPATFLDTPRVTSGEAGKRVDLSGVKGCRSVMLTALRLAHYLGFSRVYLWGADFRMDDEGPHYATGERHTPGLTAHNRSTYANLNTRLTALRPVFDAHGFRVVNVTPESSLTAFDAEGLSDALTREALRGPEGQDATGFYRAYTPTLRGEIDHFIARGGEPYSGWHQHVYVAIAAMLPGGASSVLDVGCGVGLGRGIMRRLGWAGEYTGVDIDVASAEPKTERDHLIAGDFLDVGLGTHRFDTGVCVEMLEHLPGGEADAVRVIEKLCSVCDHRIFISTPDPRTNDHGTVPRDTVTRTLRDFGWDVKSIVIGGTVLFIATGR